MPDDASPRPTQPRREREVARWDLDADVVVVGLGCAGACAAVEAAEAGARVLVLEQAAAGGGTSALSGGLIYLGGGTPVQKACGYDDTPEEMFKFLLYGSGPGADEPKVRLYCERSVEHFHWLEAHGVPFKRSFYPEPSMEAPTDDCLVFCGGEDTHPYNTIARPAPRGHKPQAPRAAGGFLMQRLLAAVERAGARLECDIGARTLVLDGTDRVAGLIALRDGQEQAVRARRGVVLSAGGFILDAEMVAQHCPALARCGWKLSSGHDDGTALRMGLGAGAAAIHMDAGEVALGLTPPRRLVRGVLVNGQGQRFINEDAYYGRIAQASIYRQGGEMYWIHDDDTYEVNDLGMEASWVADSIAELEREVGLPDGALQATLELYNRHAARAVDPLFHKGAQFLKPLDRPPFGCIDLRAQTRDYATFTLGGLRTRPGGEVLTADADPIPGLFAAGRTASGLAAFGYSSGISLGDGSFFGRLAGRSAARG
jgi:3-oxo-5alpha-steroid 4-dehydrogenase